MSNDQAKNLRELVSKVSNCKTIFFISSKEKVGKTVTVTNIGTILSEKGYKTLILDFGSGFFRTDILLKSFPKYGIKTIIDNDEPIENIIVSINENLKVIYGGSIFEEIKESKDILMKMQGYLEKLQGEFDFILIDTEETDIKSFNQMLKEDTKILFILTSNGNEELKNTYCIIKEVISCTEANDIGIIINKVDDYSIAEEIYKKLEIVSEKFLSIKISNIGYISNDTMISESIREQIPVTRLYENSKIANEFNEIVSKI